MFCSPFEKFSGFQFILLDLKYTIGNMPKSIKFRDCLLVTRRIIEYNGTMLKHDYKIDLKLFALSVIVAIILLLLPIDNPVVIIVLLIVAFGLFAYFVLPVRTSSHKYILVVVFIFLCLLGYIRWPSSEVTKNVQSAGLRMTGGQGQLKTSSISNPFKVCKNHPVENSGIKITTSIIRNENNYRTFMEQVMAIFGKYPANIETKQVIYGTISDTNGSKVKTF